MITKSVKEIDHMKDIDETFKVLQHYTIELNQKKCTFKESEKCLGYMISQRGIEVNTDKIEVTQDMKSSTMMEEVQNLTGYMVTLRRHMSRSVDKCLSFFKVFKEKKSVI